MRAATYARFSTDKQSEHSIEDQQRECGRIAQRHGIEVVAQYADRAISGGTAKRPGYQQLLAAVRRGEIDCVIAEDTSRLWRNLSEQSPRLAELSDLNVAVVTHDLDTRQEGSGMQAAMTGIMSQEFRREVGRRTRRGLEGRARAGESTGGRAYGYIAARDSSSGKVEVDREQAKVVRRIYQLYADGCSPKSIAARLNAEGVPSPGASWKGRTSRRKSKWLASAIRPHKGYGILANVKYTGQVEFGRTTWKRSAQDSKQRIVVANAKPLCTRTDERLRIVSDELWERVRARERQQQHTLGRRVRDGLRQRKAGAGKPARYPFSGLLLCASCGASYVMCNGKSYQCSSHLNGGDHACSQSLSVRRDVVEERMLASIREDLLSDEVAALVEKEARRLAAQANKDAGRPDPATIAKLQAEVDNLTDAVANGLLRSSPAIAARLQAAEAELARAKRTPKSAPVHRIVTRVRERLHALVAQLERVLGEDAEQARAALADVLGDTIVLRPDKGGKFLWAESQLQVAQLLVSNSGSGGATVQLETRRTALARGCTRCRP